MLYIVVSGLLVSFVQIFCLSTAHAHIARRSMRMRGEACILYAQWLLKLRRLRRVSGGRSGVEVDVTRRPDLAVDAPTRASCSSPTSVSS